MAEENIMAILESHFSGNVHQEDEEKPCSREDEQQVTQVQSLLSFMKISNEFATIKDSMEMFPLPGNKAESQLADNLGYAPQAGDFCRGMKATDLLMSVSFSADTMQYKIKELAGNAMDEVTKLLTEGEPLWQHDMDRGIEVLNKAEYVRRSSSKLDSTLDEIIRIISVDAPLELPIPGGATDNDCKPSGKEGFVKPDVDVCQSKSERIHQATREIGYIQTPAICVVEILMDVRLWSFVFSEMLSRAAVLGILSPGAPGTHDGALQMMTAEYHAPSPLLPTRHSCFARYCREFSNNTWIITDNSLESMIDNPLMNCKRRPSGCLIQGLPDGHTQITWIEHTEAEMGSIHPLFKSVVNSGLIFSAKHWVDTLARQIQRLNSVIQHSLGGLKREASAFDVEGILRLAERMRREFYGAISATNENKYKPLPIKGGDDILIKIVGSDSQNPTIITVTTSSWFPFTHKKVFSFLANEVNRIKWDVLALEHASQEVFHVQSGQGLEDSVSITKMEDEKGSIDTLFLQGKQESAIASYIIFSPIAYDSLVSLSNQGNIEDIPLLSSGFTILSDGKNPNHQEESAGSILTLSFQLLDSSSKARELPKKTIRKLYNLVNETISKMRVALFEPPANTNQDDVEGCLSVQREKRLKQTDEGSSINGIC